MSAPDALDALFARLNAGDASARDELFATAYPELKRLARSRLRDGGRSTLLETTSLVHETFERIQHGGGLRAEHRRAFFDYASRVMRSVIIDTLRERQAQRRGGDAVRLTLDTALGDRLAAADEQTVLEVHDALRRLAEAEPRLATAVEMRFFGGYAESTIADALGLDERTVRRDLAKASRLLAALLGG